MSGMKVYEVTHQGWYLGGRSIVIAPDEATAIALTREAVKAEGLETSHINVKQEIDLTAPRCYLVDDGDY